MKFQLLILLFLLNTFLYGSGYTGKHTKLPNPEFLTDQTNLALRQVGHLLLAIEGNDSSRVAPVQQPKEHTYLLPITQSFHYDTLPFLLQSALENLSMGQESYFVTVKDCESDTIILGYEKRQFVEGRVPCIGRHQYSKCNHIFVTFPDRLVADFTNFNAFHIYGILILVIFLVGVSFWHKGKYSENSPKSVDTASFKIQNLCTFGNCQLDVANKLLYINNEKKTLTFRETKLLHYFATHTDQLLKRETLLEEVWGDEGIIVGRSLDVFVSRLRKILKANQKVAIKTVHGVGYRLEIQNLE